MGWTAVTIPLAHMIAPILMFCPHPNVDLRITRDGYATLCVDDECSYYNPDEYYDGYDHGDHYYEFSDYDTRMIVYTDGTELVYVDNYDGTAYYYYYEYPSDYDY